jgi:iron-sulfur cluster repair protein YtfE (RIC family)
VAALAACHARIRTFTAGLARTAALPSLDDPRVPPAAAQAHRYFAEGLPLHARDEDESLAPRLRRVAPETAPLLDELAHDHEEIDRCLATLLPLLAALVAGRRADHASLRVASDRLDALLLPHIAREEAELFPRCAELSEADRTAFAQELHARRR